MVNYPVNDLYLCIQAEGAKAGTPMVLLRLMGCPVGCAFCDTKETWVKWNKREKPALIDALGTNEYWAEMDCLELAGHIATGYPNMKWVLLTGGEPAIHELKPLINALHLLEMKVAVETGGLHDGVVGAGADWVCVSPKQEFTTLKRTLNPFLMEDCDEVKQVVGKLDHIADLQNLITNYDLKSGCVISLQPIWGSDRATQLCIEAATTYGWNLSLQTHKMIGQR